MTVIRQRVAISAFTRKRTDRVATTSVSADTEQKSAFIDISAIVVGAELETGVTVALVRAERVDTRAIVADVGVTLTFVDINARITAWRQSVTVAAHALERSLEVVAFAVAADARTIPTLVDVCHTKI